MRTLTRALTAVLLPLTTAATLTLLGTGPATAEPVGPVTDSGAATTASPLPRLSDGSSVDSPADSAALDRYWSAERMRQAIPLDEAPDAREGGTARSGPTGEPGSIEPAPAPSDTTTLITESAAVGKVFFTDPGDGLDYTCSAGALNSGSKQMVITAGHCVHQGGGGDWMTNWVYIPRYRNGSAPFGTFSAKQFRAFNAWISNSDLDRDVAMVTTWPLNGDKVVNVTGGHGLSWNYSRSQAMTVLGYPGNHDGGQVQWACQGTTQRVGLLDGRIELRCDFGGGSSGGPWLREFNDSNGLGYVNGAMSTITSDGWNRSSYFDDSVKSMYDAQGDVT